MKFKLLRYIAEFIAYSIVLWLGFYNAGRELPGPFSAPWIWAIVAILPLIPWYWSGYGGEPIFWDGDD